MFWFYFYLKNKSLFGYGAEGNELWAGETEVGSVNRNSFLPSPLEIDAKFFLKHYDHARVTYIIHVMYRFIIYLAKRCIQRLVRGLPNFALKNIG